MSDTLVRALAYNGHVRAFACNTTELVRTLRDLHDATPTAITALGRVATAITMMGFMLKSEQDQVIIKVRGNGPLGTILADADASGRVRATLDHPEVSLPFREDGQVDVSAAVGAEGILSVIKDMGMKDPYQSSVPLVNGEIGDDLTYFFSTSEQTPTAIGLSVALSAETPVQAAGGFLFQLMPGAPESVVAMLEIRLEEMGSLTEMLKEGKSPKETLEEILGEEIQLLATQDLSHHCTCSQERMERALLSLGSTELKAILEEDGKAELACNFCRTGYHFDESALEELAAYAVKKEKEKHQQLN